MLLTTKARWPFLSSITVSNSSTETFMANALSHRTRFVVLLVGVRIHVHVRYYDRIGSIDTKCHCLPWHERILHFFSERGNITSAEDATTNTLNNILCCKTTVNTNNSHSPETPLQIIPSWFCKSNMWVGETRSNCRFVKGSLDRNLHRSWKPTERTCWLNQLRRFGFECAHNIRTCHMKNSPGRTPFQPTHHLHRNLLDNYRPISLLPVISFFFRKNCF